MKIVFVTKSVAIVGGKERVLLNLANHFQNLGHSVEIATYDVSKQPFLSLHSAITMSSIPITYLNPSVSFLRRVMSLSRDIRLCRRFVNHRKGAIFITTDHIVTLFVFLSTRWVRNFAIAWEHVSYTIIKSKHWMWLRNYAFSHVKKVVALNSVEAAFYTQVGCDAICVPNSIEPHFKRNIADTSHLLWMGAISFEKGIRDVVMAAKFIKKKNFLLSINVYGTGNQAVWLQDEIKLHKLQDVLKYHGVTSATEAVYNGSSLLLLTSQHECFPTVILEAFSYGVPVISYNSPTGPATMIEDNVNGYLVEMGDHQQLVNQANTLVSNKGQLESMSNAAFQSSKKYDPLLVNKLWDGVLNLFAE